MGRSGVAPTFPGRTRGLLLALGGSVVLSFDALLVRLADTGSYEVIFWRGWLIFVSLTLVVRLLHRRWPWDCAREDGTSAWVIAVGMGFSSILFVQAVLHTTIANVLVLLSLAPVFAVLFSGVLMREWITGPAWVVVLLCMLGTWIMIIGSHGQGHVSGDLMALGAAVVVGINLSMLRRSRSVRHLPVIALSGAVAGLIVIPFASPLAVSPTGFAVLLLMGCIQMPLALLLLTRSLYYLPSAETATFLVIEAVFGSLWAFLILSEAPTTATFLGGTLILMTLLVHILRSLFQRSRC